MDLGTKIIVLVVAVISLGSAIIALRTARLKHDTEASGTSGGNAKKQPGPFDPMFQIMGAFGVALGPALMVFIVYMIVAGGTQLLSPTQPGERDHSEMVDRKLLNAKETRLFDIATTAAGMSPGRDRDRALRHAVNLAISEKAYLIALMAAAKMEEGKKGSDRDEVLTFIAVSAVENNDPVTADKAVRAMVTGRARDNAARKVMSILEGRKVLDRPSAKP